ncbi:MAG TPA: hypothetical protein VHV77_17950, partial [Pirellulales bacterium]|nr:hypothetical protein [Pirellulales bacterium]
PANISRDRRAALWALENGGEIGMVVDGSENEQTVEHVNDLPAQDFAVVRIDIASIDQLRDADLKLISGLPKLSYLRLTNAPLTDIGFAQLRDLPSLSAIIISGTEVTDRTLEHFASFKTITELNLADTNISDARLDALHSLPALKILWLERTNVTDEGAPSIARLQGLTDISLRRTGMSDAVVTKLKLLMPNCKFKAKGS